MIPRYPAPALPTLWSPLVAALTPPTPPQVADPWFEYPCASGPWPPSATRAASLGMGALLLRLAWTAPHPAAPLIWWWTGPEALRLGLTRELAATWGQPWLHLALAAPNGTTVLETGLPRALGAGAVIVVSGLTTAAPAVQAAVAAALGGGAGPLHPSTIVIGFGAAGEPPPAAWPAPQTIPWTGTSSEVDGRWFQPDLAPTLGAAAALARWWQSWAILSETTGLLPPDPALIRAWAALLEAGDPGAAAAQITATCPAGAPPAWAATLTRLTTTCWAALHPDPAPAPTLEVL